MSRSFPSTLWASVSQQEGEKKGGRKDGSELRSNILSVFCRTTQALISISAPVIVSVCARPEELQALITGTSGHITSKGCGSGVGSDTVLLGMGQGWAWPAPLTGHSPLVPTIIF